MTLSIGNRISSNVFSGSASIVTTTPNEIVVIYLGVWGYAFDAYAVTVGTYSYATLRQQAMASNGCSMAVYDISVADPGTYDIAWTQPTNQYAIDIMEAICIRGNPAATALDYAISTDTSMSVAVASGGAGVIFRQINGSTPPSTPTVSGQTVTVQHTGTIGSSNSWGVYTFTQASAATDTVTSASSGSSSYDVAMVLSYEAQNTPPTTSITTPTTNQKVDPRADLTVGWTYADAESTPEAQWEVSYMGANDFGYTVINSGTGTATSYVIPANTLPDEQNVTIGVRVYDGKDWSTRAGVVVNSDSWTYGTVASTATQRVTTDVIPWSGDTDVQIRTADFSGFGPWSGTQAFPVATTSYYVRYGGSTVPSVKYVRQNGAWVSAPTKRLTVAVYPGTSLYPSIGVNPDAGGWK